MYVCEESQEQIQQSLDSSDYMGEGWSGLPGHPITGEKISDTANIQ